MTVGSVIPFAELSMIADRRLLTERLREAVFGLSPGAAIGLRAVG